MKTKLLLLFIMTISQFALGQINKGAIMIEGTMSYSQNNSESKNVLNGTTTSIESNSTSCFLRPKIGYFVTKTFLVGLGFDYEYGTSEYRYPQLGEQTSKSNLYLISPYVRKYIKINDKIYFHIALSVSWGKGESEENTSSEVTHDLVTIRSNLTPGFTYHFSRQWAIIANFGQLYYNYNESTLSSENSFDEPPVEVDSYFGASFAFNTFGVGVQYLLHNKGGE